MLPKTTINDLRRQHKEMVEEEARLTLRERQVLQLLAEGKAMKEVGYILKITTQTVGFHKYRLMRKLGAKNDGDLVRFAVRNYLVAASG
jgi:DNA-binding CsgD family transcriptional regulator